MEKFKTIVYRKIIRGRVFQKVIYSIRIIISFVITIACSKSVIKYTDIWPLGTGDDRYENNIRAFDNYLRKNGKRVIWVVDKKHLSESLWKDKEAVSRGSIKNYIIANNCYACVFSHNDWDIAPGLFRLKKTHRAVLLYIEHAPSGIKRSPSDLHAKIPADIQCCLSEYEKALKLNEGAHEKSTRITGFAGYDDYSIRDKGLPIIKILIMPTWRDWDLNGNRDFKSTNLFRYYSKLFNDEVFYEIIKKRSVTFILHPTAARYFNINPENVFSDCVCKINVIAGNDGKMRNEIITSDLLITDYSTLCLDFLYMEKPVLFYWYDSDEYDKKHGLLVSEKEMGNALARTQNELVKKLDTIVANPKSYTQLPLADEYFDFHDHENCCRILEEVNKEYKSRNVK